MPIGSWNIPRGNPDRLVLRCFRRKRPYRLGRHRGWKPVGPAPSRIFVTDDARRRDCAKSLLGVQIRIPGSDRVRSPWCRGFCGNFQGNHAPEPHRPHSQTDLRPPQLSEPQSIAGLVQVVILLRVIWNMATNLSSPGVVRRQGCGCREAPDHPERDRLPVNQSSA